jgi:integration host factor subunit alpha
MTFYVQDKTGLPMNKTERAVEAVFDFITDELAQGREVRVHNFGTFKVRNMGARMGRNPQTGEPINIPAHKKVVFTPAKYFKDQVN